MALKLEEFSRVDRDKLGIIDLWWAEVKDHSFSDKRPFSAYLCTDYGLMVYEDKRPICAIFLYPIMGSCIAIVGFPISNPLVTKELRREALKLLVAGAEEKAKKMQFSLLFGYAGNMVAKKFYDKFGFMKATENITNFIKKV